MKLRIRESKYSSLRRVKHLVWTVLGSNPRGQTPKLLIMQIKKCVERGLHNTIGSERECGRPKIA